MHPYFFEKLAQERQRQLECDAELARLSARFPHPRARAQRLLDALLRRSRRRLIVLPDPEPLHDELRVLPGQVAGAVGADVTTPARTGGHRDALVR